MNGNHLLRYPAKWRPAAISQVTSRNVLHNVSVLVAKHFVGTFRGLPANLPLHAVFYVKQLPEPVLIDHFLCCFFPVLELWNQIEKLLKCSIKNIQWIAKSLIWLVTSDRIQLHDGVSIDDEFANKTFLICAVVSVKHDDFWASATRYQAGNWIFTKRYVIEQLFGFLAVGINAQWAISRRCALCLGGFMSVQQPDPLCLHLFDLKICEPKR